MLECGAKNAKVMDLIPVQSTHLKAGPDAPFQPHQIQNILWLCENED